MKAPALPLLAHIRVLITQTVWITEVDTPTQGVVICCGDYDPELTGRKHCMILDDPTQIDGCEDGVLNFYDFDSRQQEWPIEILSILTPEEAYTHPHEYVRLAMQAIKIGEEPLDYINEWEEGGGTLQRRFTKK